jgi:hypothetical protein
MLGMATLAATNRLSVATDASPSYQRFASVCAILAGIVTLVYSVAFVLLANEPLASVSLLANGLLGTVVMVCLYERLKAADTSYALWALLLALAGSLGAALHGGYDLAALLHQHGPVDASLPSSVDPRGLLTFGASGIGLWVFSQLIARGTSDFPKLLGYLGYVVAALQIVLYLGRLILFDAANPVIVVPALLAGFIATPLWYAWLGVSLWRGARA